MINDLLIKIHVRSGGLIVGAVLAFVGVVMVFQGISDEGFVDLHSALVNGKLKTGLVGVTFSFLGAIVSVACVLAKPTLQKLKVKKGKTSIEWEGMVNSARAMLVQMESMIQTLEAEQDSANKPLHPIAEKAGSG